MLLGNLKLRQDTTTYQLEWQHFKTLTTNADEAVEQQELSCIADVNAK